MRTAVVTGAAQGVGFATAALLGRKGYQVLMTDLQPLDGPLARLQAEGLRVQAICGDVSSEDLLKSWRLGLRPTTARLTFWSIMPGSA